MVRLASIILYLYNVFSRDFVTFVHRLLTVFSCFALWFYLVFAWALSLSCINLPCALVAYGMWGLFWDILWWLHFASYGNWRVLCNKYITLLSRKSTFVETEYSEHSYGVILWLFGVCFAICVHLLYSNGCLFPSIIYSVVNFNKKYYQLKIHQCFYYECVLTLITLWFQHADLLLNEVYHASLHWTCQLFQRHAKNSIIHCYDAFLYLHLHILQIV